MTAQQAYEKRMKKRERKNRIGIRICVDPIVKKARSLELQADEFRNADRYDVKLNKWRRKNKKS